MEKTNGKGYQLLKMMPEYDSKEKKLKKQISTVDKCTPVYITCKGTQGAINLKATPIVQNRLLGPTIKNINCGTTLSELGDYVRGDPGSVFTFISPESCASGGNLIGTGLYGFKSSICKAAIQQNQLSNSSSGYVSIVIG